MNVEELNKQFQESKAEDVIAYFLKEYGQEAALSSSLGAEDQVLTDMIFKNDKSSNIFTLDTGRLHPETYNVMDETNLKYNVKLNVFFPKNEMIEKLYETQGVNGHFESIDNRKNCCGIRKMEPLKRALKPLKVWFTGLRAAQSVTRTDMPIVEFDENFDVIKVNPLINWREEDVWEYINDNNVPYNKLHKQGYPSIGCAPCTRPVKAGEDIRSGRWWWENPEHKECGLHAK
ncbi:phosphoadenylyl-sulfate reductase [Arcobacteraceae bacterium]|nr:phosphoadenylyl-sulfate reductase [Arcobacteraceae bacterium]